MHAFWSRMMQSCFVNGWHQLGIKTFVPAQVVVMPSHEEENRQSVALVTALIGQELNSRLFPALTAGSICICIMLGEECRLQGLQQLML